MAEIIIIGLCALTAFLCAGLLIRGYFQYRLRLFLWTGLYFLILAINTVLHVMDIHLLTAIDFRTVRLIISLLGMSFLIHGLIFESEEESEHD